MNKWIAFVKLTPAMQESAVRWIQHRLAHLSRYGNSPRRPAGWPAETAPHCKFLVTPGGDIWDAAAVGDDAPRPKSIFQP